jgi:uncharacterized integral membrane protein
MKLSVLPYVLLLAVLSILAVANWPELTRTADLEFVLARASVPAGLLALMLIGIVLLADWTVYWLMRARWDRERRVLNEQLADLRDRAGEAGTAREVALREFIASESASIRAQLQELRSDVTTRTHLPEISRRAHGPS